MAPQKRGRAVPVAQFLDLDAAEEEEGAVSREERTSDKEDFTREEQVDEDEDDDGNDNERPQIEFDGPEEQRQSFLNALCNCLVARYVREPQEPEAERSNNILPVVSSSILPARIPSPLPSSPRSTGHEVSPTLITPGFTPSSHAIRHSSVSLPSRKGKERAQEPKGNDEEQQTKIRRREQILNLPSHNSRELEEANKIYLEDTRVHHADWVKIRSGPYRGNVGLAMGIPQSEKELNDMEREKQREARHFTNTELLKEFKAHYGYRYWDSLNIRKDKFEVLLVPCLRPPKRKRSGDDTQARRPKARLFNHTDYLGIRIETIAVFDLPKGSDPPTHECDDIIYKEQVFNDGLLVARYPSSQLELATSIPLNLEKLLLNSKHPWVHHTPLPHPANWSFEEGEEVTWMDSSRTSKIGNFINLVVNLRHIEPQTAIISFLDGVFPVPSRQLLKTLQTDDQIAASILVVLDQERSGEDRQIVSAHVNTVKRISLHVELLKLGFSQCVKERVPIPWRGAEVRVTKGCFAKSRGIVETVERVESRLGRKLLLGIWLHGELKLIVVDYEAVVHIGSLKKLNEWQQLSPIQHTVYGLSQAMSTSREPWQGVRVRIVHGEYKGQFGYVRRVNVTWDTKNLMKDAHVKGKTIGRRRGIDLTIDLETQRAAGSCTQVINYLKVVDAGSCKHLNQAYPVKTGDFYDYRPDLPDVKLVADELNLVAPPTPMWSAEEQMAMHADGNTHWDADSEFPMPFGWREGLSTSDNDTLTAFDIDTNYVPLSPPTVNGCTSSLNPAALDPLEQAQADALAAFVLEAQREAKAEEAAATPEAQQPRHWITCPKLIGLSIEATVGANSNKFLTISSTPGGEVVASYKKGLGTITVHDTGVIQQSLNLIKPSTEKNLMVVVAGDPEHIGKLMVVAVIMKNPVTGEEISTEERLDVDPKTHLARVYEMDKARADANVYMNPLRDAVMNKKKRHVEIRHRSS
ncbi:hypothetical protein V5O48_016465 [Marasmius crinis-equi]|uniref:Uncharacterized protein n=1 Tax=Marasmius crinis-equi TaxID=585013 RepID=A0ABR3ERX7_9AGAR